MLLTLDDALQHLIDEGEMGSLTPGERRLINQAQQLLESDQPRQHRERVSKADRRKEGESNRQLERQWGSIPDRRRGS